MSVIEQFRPIFKSIDKSMEVIEQAPPTARLALLAYLQLVALRVEKKAMKEYKDNNLTRADVECIMFAMSTKKQCNKELRASIREGGSNETYEN